MLCLFIAILCLFCNHAVFVYSHTVFVCNHAVFVYSHTVFVCNHAVFVYSHTVFVYNHAVFVCSEFQDHNDGLSAHWDVSGDPCPTDKLEWAIHKFDGTVVLKLTELPAGRSGDIFHGFMLSTVQ